MLLDKLIKMAFRKTNDTETNNNVCIRVCIYTYLSLFLTYKCREEHRLYYNMTWTQSSLLI